MAKITISKDELEEILANEDLASGVADIIFEQTGGDFWFDILLKTMSENKTLITSVIGDTVKLYLDRELKYLVQEAINEEVTTAIRETIENKVDVLLTKRD